MNLKTITIELAVGDTIMVKGRKERINKIEYFARTGEIDLKTTGGSRRALTFQLVDDHSAESFDNAADRYR